VQKLNRGQLKLITVAKDNKDILAKSPASGVSFALLPYQKRKQKSQAPAALPAGTSILHS